jgi:adenylosuccinate lyase
VHSQAAGREVKEFGRPNDLIERLKADPGFSKVDVGATLDARRYIGRAPQQVDEFVEEFVKPIRKKYSADLQRATEGLRV